MFAVDNGIVGFTLDGRNLALTSIRYKGEEFVSRAAPANRVVWEIGAADGEAGMPSAAKVPKRGSSVVADAACTVRASTPEMVDIGCVHTWRRRDPEPVDVEVHYVLRQRKPGIYAYAILRHPASYPALHVGEWRMVWPTADKDGSRLLDKIYVDFNRHWTMPSPAEVANSRPTGLPGLSLFGTGAWAGRMESPYTYALSYEDNGAFGFASDTRKLGAWVVLGNHDYFNDGPQQQGLSGDDGTFTVELLRDNYRGTPIDVPAGQEWSKGFGPLLLFFNSGMVADALWWDARAQASIEHDQWPYTWLPPQPEYPTGTGRSSVTGRLLVADTIKPRQNGGFAWIGLAQPAPGLDFQSDANHYQYWTTAKADGTFAIRGVRPGTYTLYAYMDGEAGQYVRENVAVEAGQPNRLGNLTWTVPRSGSRLAWEIGTPNRDSTEFRHGTDFFTPFLYKTFSREFANPLVYDVAHSDPGKDWNYVQSMYVTPDGRAVPWRWSVQFQLSAVPSSGEAALDLALAGSNGARLRLTLNGEKLDEFEPKLDGGNALLRQSSHAKYSSYSIRVPLSALRAGENSLDLDMIPLAGEGSAIFYDYLALELP